MVDYTKVSVSEVIKARLDANQDDDETRNEQMERLLAADEGDVEVHGDVDLQPVFEQLQELQSQNEQLKQMLDSQPNLDDVRNAAESGASDAVESATRR